MLILSQHKIVILNFNTTTTIIADKNEIIARLINGNKATLGEYATEERAKEVLQEIIEFLDRKSLVEMDRDDITMQVLGNIYRMPKE